MSNVEKEARAKAKAAKAEAKALRPFWKKKRWWLVGGVALIVAVGVSSAEDDSSQTDTSKGAESRSSQDAGTENTVGKGLGSKDASTDVIDLNCAASDELGFSYPEVTVKNNSSKPSTYFITMVAESADGSIRYDDTIIMINALQPAQTTTESGMFTKELPRGAVCKITEIQRTAS